MALKQWLMPHLEMLQFYIKNSLINWKDQSQRIISGNHNDEKKFWEYTDKNKHKQQIEDFKKPLGTGKGQSNLSILIVKDMLLTGFDAPIAQVCI